MDTAYDSKQTPHNRQDLTWHYGKNTLIVMAQVGGCYNVARVAETRYSATEIDLLAVVWACKKASLFLSGNDFEVVVDH